MEANPLVSAKTRERERERERERKREEEKSPSYSNHDPNSDQPSDGTKDWRARLLFTNAYASMPGMQAIGCAWMQTGASTNRAAARALAKKSCPKRIVQGLSAPRRFFSRIADASADRQSESSPVLHPMQIRHI